MFVVVNTYEMMTIIPFLRLMQITELKMRKQQYGDIS